MKVAMENVVLIVCPPGFAPLISQRHTSPTRRGPAAFSRPPPALRFEVFVDLFREVITPADREGDENRRKSGERDAGPM